MAAISNSNSLIFYAAIGRLGLLQEIYGEVFIPPAVWQETVDRGTGLPGATEIREARWIQQQSPSPQAVTSLPLADLDKGEADAIALAMSFRPRVPLILGDLPARRVAQNAGLDIVGTGGVLVLAKRMGLIASVESLLTEFRSAGLYLSEAVVDTFLELANER